MDKLKQLETFVSVAQRGSLAGAARALGLAPAIIGRRLDALEAHLGIKLLLRTTRRLSLTNEGSAFLEDCQRLLADLATAEASVSAGGLQATGHLRITAPAGFGRRHIAPLVPLFRELHPEVTISLNLSDRLVDMAVEGFDCAVRVGDMPDSSLVSVRLADNRRLCVATPAFLARHGVPQKPADLARFQCLTLSSDASQTRGWAFKVSGDGVASVVHIMRYFPAIIDSGDEKDFYYIIMEYIEGITLSDYINESLRKPPPVNDVLTILVNLTEALAAMYSIGIVHGDLSAENVMIQSDGSVKLIDFEKGSMNNKLSVNTIGSTNLRPNSTEVNIINQEDEPEGLGYLFLAIKLLSIIPLPKSLVLSIIRKVLECEDTCKNVYIECIQVIQDYNGSSGGDPQPRSQGGSPVSDPNTRRRKLRKRKTRRL